MNDYIFIDLTKDEEPKTKTIKIKKEDDNTQKKQTTSEKKKRIKQTRRKYYLKNKEKIKAGNKQRYELIKTLNFLNKMII